MHVGTNAKKVEKKTKSKLMINLKTETNEMKNQKLVLNRYPDDSSYKGRIALVNAKIDEHFFEMCFPLLVHPTWPHAAAQKM